MKRSLVVVMALAMVLAISASAMAAQGTWLSSAANSTGKMTDAGSQSAMVVTSRTGTASMVTGLNWTAVSSNSGDYAVNKGVDYSTTTDGVWNINDNNSIRTTTDGNTYQKTYITPTTLDNSRGIVMAKIKVNSGTSNTNTAFGVSLGNGKGVQLAFRASNLQWRIRDGEGGTGASDPANIDQSVYRVYAISWIGDIANVWYSNGTDWTGTQSDWTQAATNFTMGGASLKYNTATTLQDSINGIVLYTGSSGNVLNADMQWVAQSTYDDINGEMTPWNFNMASVTPVPEPGSIVAMLSGLVGLAGFSIRRKRA